MNLLFYSIFSFLCLMLIECTWCAERWIFLLERYLVCISDLHKAALFKVALCSIYNVNEVMIQTQKYDFFLSLTE